MILTNNKYGSGKVQCKLKGLRQSDRLAGGGQSAYIDLRSSFLFKPTSTASLNPSGRDSCRTLTMMSQNKSTSGADQPKVFDSSKIFLSEAAQK